MSDLFIKICNLGITAGWIVLAVLLLRLVLKKAPKWIHCALWSIVALRLVFPFSPRSIFSLIPNSEPIPEDITMARTPAINSGIDVVNRVVNPVLADSFSPEPWASANPLQILVAIAWNVWILGIIVMLVYGAVSYLRLALRVRPSIRDGKILYLCDTIDTPFILGVLRPRIYLPSGMPEEHRACVLEHENAHLKRGDHLWKPLAFLLLSVYWFHPLLWVAYILLCRDIEAACDEKVVRGMDDGARKGYSEALLSCSMHRRLVMACPLAFGEVGVKERIRSVLSYKKPAFWIIVVAIIASLIAAACLLTDPKNDPKSIEDEVICVEITHLSCLHTEPSYEQYYAIQEGVLYELPYENGSYNVAFSVKKIKRSSYVIELTRELSLKVGESEWESVTSVELKRGETLLLSTPTDGGGENYEFSILPASELDGIVPSAGDIYAPDGVTEEQIAKLRETHPHYFGLDTTYGLDVYVGQMAARSYNCYLRSTKPDGTNESFEDTLAIWQLGGLSISDMRAVLSSYGIESVKIHVVPYAIPYSSYWVPTSDAYVTSLRILLGLAPQRSDYSSIYDTATFDVDGDGIDEICEMSVGPTSGRFSFVFTAREIGAEEIEYKTTIHSQVYDLSFVKGEDGVTRVQGITQGENPETHLFDIAVKVKYISLTENGIPIWEILTPAEE